MLAERTVERDALKVARIAYASEFGFDEEGQPDVGSIHQNIRKLKAASVLALETLETNLEVMKRDWDRIDGEWGPSTGGIEAAIDGSLTGYEYFQQTIESIEALKAVLT